MTLPRATYRLQFRNGMTFDGAAALAPYLARLGISHLYASPIFTAAPGSTHGYDVADHGAFDPVLGGREGFDRMVKALRAQDIGLILDIVPNHMAADLANPWWLSVVEWGRQSPWSGHFDVDWSERLTLPMLGRPYAEALEAGEVRLGIDVTNGWIGLALGTLVIPLHPASYESVLAQFPAAAARRIVEEAGRATPDGGTAFHERMQLLLSDADEFAGQMATASRDPGFVDWVHGQQPYQLTYWKDARRHLSYRRFFEITGLVGVRVEDDAVFDDVHRLVLDLVQKGLVDGLRIDHVDGLADPAGYLKRLRAAIGPDVYFVVEKILEGDETLPPDWPVDGTTGYEFIDSLVDLFVDETGTTALDDAHARTLGERPDAEAMIQAARQRTLTHNFAGELATLARLASKTIAQAGERIAEEVFGEAIAAVIVAIRVYRTYGTRDGMAPQDRDIVHRAAREAIDRLGAGRRRPVELVERLLVGDVTPGTEETARIFREKLQQLSGPVMAKAVEDTVFYRYNRLIAVNEVGCDPVRRSGSIARFHARLGRAAERGDQSLLGTATHDTKRGEDARARLYALSEAPAAWGEAVDRWRGLHRDAVVVLPDGPAPEPATEWLVYQALAGVWPGDGLTPSAEALGSLQTRFLPYLEKSLREAKTRTSWTDEQTDYEAAVAAYAQRLLDPANRSFHDDFTTTLHPFAAAGRINSLSQTLVKLTAPGVPDVYQGSECGDFSLVDPDNRQPVDFSTLADRLDQRDADGAAAGAQPSAFEREKQDLIAAVLRWRGQRPDLFSSGRYIPLAIEGARARHAVAFARQAGESIAVTVASRLVLGGIDPSTGRVPSSWWGDTRVSPAPGISGVHLHDILSGGNHSADGLTLRALLAHRPVALLAR
ncbi:malto-oligosyltrehalose synthase [Aquibium microcysteis]|uniref:malto-oligosyltrehalose synthase n=1 Tax=Aquibium microcysteis TaxID=675281 RepID=UPI00165D235F|nr:malto-oligosyltrehalose synthase [Aquibium microcysteis]